MSAATIVEAPMPLVAGVDVGGTKTEAVLLDARGAELSRARVSTRTGPAGVVGSVADAVAAARRAAGPTGRGGLLRAVGVGVPGAVDAATGTVGRAVNLDVEDLDLARRLEAALGCAVVVDNDVNLAAVGLARSRRPSTPSLAFLNLGTGMGAGVVLDGTLLRGTRGAAGEIGHLCFDPRGPRCGCGMTGCLELYASGSGLLRASGGVPVAEVFARAERGEPRSSAIAARFSTALAEAVRVLAQAYDPAVIALGGGVFASERLFLPRVRRVIGEWEASSTFVRSLRIGERLTVVEATSAVAATGAALWAAEIAASTAAGSAPALRR